MAPKGKYFVIQSKQSGLALDISGGSANPGTAVVMWDKHGRDNQVWFHEPVTKTIRTKANPDMCLSINGSNRLVINAYHGDHNQHWRYNKQRDVVENASNPGKVLDVVGASGNKGAEVCAWDHHGRDNQRWKLDFQPAKYFYIKSEMNGKVLDIQGGNKSAGTKVIMYGQKGGHKDNQLWFEDSFGNIRSKLEENFVLDGNGDLHVNTYQEGKNRVFWAAHGNKVVNVNNPNECLDIKGNNSGDGAEVCAWNYKGSANQHWRFEFI